MKNSLKLTLALGLVGVLASAVPGFSQAFTVVGNVDNTIDTGAWSAVEAYVEGGTVGAGTEICVQDTSRAASDPLAVLYADTGSSMTFSFTTQFEGVDAACSPASSSSILCIVGGWNEGGMTHNGWFWNDAQDLSTVSGFFIISDDNPTGVEVPEQIPVPTCLAGDGRVGLTWTEPAAGDPGLGHRIAWNVYAMGPHAVGTGPDAFMVSEYETAGVAIQVLDGSPQAVIDSLTNDQEYCFALSPVFMDDRIAKAHDADVAPSQGATVVANIGSDVCCMPEAFQAVFGSVSATALRKVNQVDWTTTLEDGTVGFVVEVALSPRGPWYPKSGTIAATGAGSSYSWRHTGLDLSKAAVYYYRVREVSSDSSAAPVFSDVVSVERGGFSVTKGPGTLSD
jgi:hypothetical protein